jgi:peptidoglycan/xylan/chitin deacetylase (PgdA/CDA1 family)
LAILELHRVPATFFEVGMEVALYPQYTRMVAVAGYPVENHTWSHVNLATIPVSGFSLQIDQTQSEIRSVTGVTPACVRPPYNSWDATALDQIAQRGLATMSYSIDPQDWSLPGVQAIVNRVVGAALPGGVVVMHDAGGPREQTVAALPQIITDLEAEGYTFVSICGGRP